jgi:hypothetical protein
MVISLVELALARPPAEREDYPRGACGGDGELLSQVRSYVEWESLTTVRAV